MIVVEQQKVVFFDVDDTLVSWDITEDEADIVEIPAPYYGPTPITFRLKVFKRHITNLKRHAERGHYVVVWSAGGSRWAELVIKALGLEDAVDLVISKPDWVYDDLPASEIIPISNRRYYPENK